MAEVSGRTKIILNIIMGFIILALNILIYTLVVIGVKWGSEEAGKFAYQIYGDVSVAEDPGEDIPFDISEGQGTMDIAVRLQNAGVIIDKYTFYIRAKISTGSRKPILPGTYKLNNSMNYKEILYIITNETTIQENVNGV